jgi:hypothetical protein
VATIALVVIAVGLTLLVVIGLVGAFDPFGSDTVDRSGPAVLERIRTLEEFTAGEANFSQDVDIAQDANILPDFLQGERVTAIVTGRVPATVDFSALGPDAVEVSEDRSTIRLTLPEPVLGTPIIDQQNTRIVARNRGLFNRIGDAFSDNPFDDGPLYEAAQEKLAEAARQSDLEAQARANTERWLRTFLGAAGFDVVEISWTRPPT